MRIQCNCWQCEFPDCGHVWIAQSEDPPNQCAKCRRRNWDKGGVQPLREYKKRDKKTATHLVTDAVATTGAKVTIAHQEPAKQNIDFLKKITGVTTAAAIARPVHDLKTCRLYGCLMCKVAKGEK